MIVGIRKSGGAWDSRTSFGSIADGLSNTIFIGEKHIQSNHSGWSRGTGRSGTATRPNVSRGSPGRAKGSSRTSTAPRTSGSAATTRRRASSCSATAASKALSVTTPESTMSLLIQRDDGQPDSGVLR